jgi:glycosyltransferase involved in cell wall biosynthesis
LRLLFLAPFPPRRDGAHGGSRAAAELLVRLAERHRVALVHLRGRQEGPADHALLEQCDLVREVARRPPAGALGRLGRRLRVARELARGTPAAVAGSWSPEFAAVVAEVAKSWHPDIVQLEYHVMGAYLAALASCPAPRVLRQYEPGAATARDRAAHRSGLARLAAGLDERAWARFERRVMTRVHVVVALTDRDAAALRPLAGATPIEIIPLGVSAPQRALEATGEAPELLFVGNFIHPPNIESVERLIHTILPLVRAQCPSAVLHIVGANPPARWQGRETAGVLVSPDVPDVAPFLERAAVVMAPMWSGGGMRVKVMEALAAGKAVVATPLAVEGLAVEDGNQARIGQTDRELAEAALDLLRYPDRRIALGQRARAWAVKQLGWERPVAAYERLYASVLAGRQTPSETLGNGDGRC